VGLGHRRLSILDISDMGRQPMNTLSNRYYIVFNGEIYNFVELKCELEERGKEFKGRSDTEVLLAAIELWGVREALRRSVGMFAVAIWDSFEEVLYLARDRIGEKPLYWGIHNGQLVFASELSAIRANPRTDTRVSIAAFVSYLKNGYINANQSIFESYRQVAPGSVCVIPARDLTNIKDFTYWELTDRLPRFRGDFNEAAGELKRRLDEAVRIQMRSDVPLGLFLSGGVDSSLICAVAQENSPRPLSTFTIGFKESEYDESKYGRDVASILGTSHESFMFADEDIKRIYGRIGKVYSEPFADFSQLPTVLLSEVTRKKVTVALSGDGGDELFLGYGRYARFSALWGLVEKLQRLHLAGIVNSRSLDRIQEDTTVGRKAKRIIEFLRSGNCIHAYEAFVSRMIDPRVVVNLEVINSREAPVGEGVSVLDEVSRWDIVNYLSSDILTKVDRASMSVGLEVRVPLLDYRVVEFARSLPIEYRCFKQQPKGILREILNGYLPASLFERQKRGFSPPLARWLRGPLKEATLDLLSAKSLATSPIPWKCERIEKMLKRHFSGGCDFSTILWIVSMFEMWRREWLR